MTTNTPLADGQAAQARAALLCLLMSARPLMDGVTELGRLAVERAIWTDEARKDRQQLGLPETGPTAAVSLIVEGGGKA